VAGEFQYFSLKTLRGAPSPPLRNLQAPRPPLAVSTTATTTASAAGRHAFIFAEALWRYRRGAALQAYKRHFSLFAFSYRVFRMPCDNAADVPAFPSSITFAAGYATYLHQALALRAAL